MYSYLTDRPCSGMSCLAINMHENWIHVYDCTFRQSIWVRRRPHVWRSPCRKGRHPWAHHDLRRTVIMMLVTTIRTTVIVITANLSDLWLFWCRSTPDRHVFASRAKPRRAMSRFRIRVQGLVLSQDLVEQKTKLPVYQKILASRRPCATEDPAMHI